MKTPSFAKNLALINIAFALFIILWGAWVRLSGSGAGCGDHWPLCNGQVIPTSMQLKTIIELTHRITSGLFGFTILGFVIYVFKKFPGKHPVRGAGLWALFLTLVEALIGAVLVKKGLVVDNSSWQRAFVIAIHLVNTLFLIYSLVACYYYSLKLNFKKYILSQKDKILYGVAILVFLFVGGSGAITALGNTLFPESSLVEGLYNDFNPASHFLIKLRLYHPLSAIFLFFLLIHLSKRADLLVGNPYAKTLMVLAFVGVGFGLVNWLLMAPVWGALVHLLIADFIWILFSLNFLYSRFR